MIHSGAHILKKAIARLLLAALTVVLAGPALAADLAVTVRPGSEVTGAKIHLADIAGITGPECALKNDLADIYITKAPSPGERTVIRLAYLEHRIKSSGLPLDQARWSLPDRVTVVRKHQAVDEAWVRDVMEKYLRSVEPYKSGQWELVDVRTGKLPNLPVGDLEYRIAPNSSANPTRVILNIYLTVNDGDAGKIRASGKVDLRVRAVVAVRRLERGHVIQPEDLQIARVNVSRLKAGALADPGRAYGMACRRGLQAGQPLHARDLLRESVVKRGEMVTILAQSGPLKVTCTGQARQEGAVGDSIKVLNTSSKKMILAKIIGPAIVQVQF